MINSALTGRLLSLICRTAHFQTPPLLLAGSCSACQLSHGLSGREASQLLPAIMRELAGAAPQLKLQGGFQSALQCAAPPAPRKRRITGPESIQSSRKKCE